MKIQNLRKQHLLLFTQGGGGGVEVGQNSTDHTNDCHWLRGQPAATGVHGRRLLRGQGIPLPSLCAIKSKYNFLRCMTVNC